MIYFISIFAHFLIVHQQAHFHIVHQQAQVSSLETCYSNLESQIIVLLSEYIEQQQLCPWSSSNYCWKILWNDCEAASEPQMPKNAHCIPVLSLHYIGKCAAHVLMRSASTVVFQTPDCQISWHQPISGKIHPCIIKTNQNLKRKSLRISFSPK